MDKKFAGLAAAGVLGLLLGLSFFLSPRSRAPFTEPDPSLSSAPISQSAFLLNTFVTVTIYGSDDITILDHAMALCKEYEQVFSKTLEESELYALNHRNKDITSVTVSDDMAALLKKGLFYSSLSQGAFDITIEPVSSLWNFTDSRHTLPEANILAEQAAKVNYKTLILEDNTLTFLSPNTSIDLGAIAKGYIADRMKEDLEAAGVQSAIINLGGNILTIGSRPGGLPFHIGLRKPYASRQEPFQTLAINDLSVVTSGVYERHFEKDGVNYHHLLNPRTGMPYNNGLIAVTVITEASVDGDGLSTVLFSLGLDAGMDLANQLDGVYACFIDDEYQVYFSDGMENFLLEDFSLPQG